MTPSSDKNSQFDSRNRSELLKAIGNPTATEEEWLSACEKLGDYQQPKSRRKNIPLSIGKSAVGAAVLTAIVYGGINVSSLINLKPIPAPVAHAPAAVDIDYSAYMPELQRRIKRLWFPPRGNETKRVVAVFKVHSDGRLDGVKISKSSGVAVCDAAALRAIENASPVRALPSGAPENVDIEFTFDYNVFNKKIKSQ